jgi:triosephosphate isomerase (TIM)
MLIVSNWKAHVETVEKAKKLFTTAKRLKDNTRHELCLAPPYPHLGLLAWRNKSRVTFAAQDVSATLGGAETGEVSAQILSDLGASYVLVGHSERRAMGEKDEVIAEKARHALAHGLSPILCVGEAVRDEGGEYLATVRAQIAAVFAGLSPQERLKMLIAYEPLWAIGKSAAEAIAPPDLTEMVLYIRKVLGDYVPGKAPARIKILYGGSVEAGDARALAGGSGVDGFLVGHASADPAQFTALIKALS